MNAVKAAIGACALSIAGFGGYFVRDVTDDSPKYLIYIVEREGRGKFGYTEKDRQESVSAALKERWSNGDFTPYWTHVVRTKDDALAFERWAKTQVEINHGREFFAIDQVPDLVMRSAEKFPRSVRY